MLQPAVSFPHVGYVLTAEELHAHAGSDVDFLFSALHNSFNLCLILGTLALVYLIYRALRRNVWFLSKVTSVAERTASYHELIPWTLRLSLGITLIGAGIANVLVTPSLALAEFSQLSFLQILLGFLLLTGFLLAPVCFLAAILFVFALSRDFYLIGNLDFLAAAMALCILADPKPGLDDLLGIPFFSPFKSLRQWVPLVLRIGIGGAMMFLAVYEKFLNPHFSAVVVQNYQLTSVIPVSPAMWVLSAGLIEFAIGLLLFVGFRTRLIAATTFLVLTLSFFYFGEAVYAHVTLFGILWVLFITDGGKLSFQIDTDACPRAVTQC